MIKLIYEDVGKKDEFYEKGIKKYSKFYHNFNYYITFIGSSDFIVELSF
jgi:hypothetical protein